MLHPKEDIPLKCTVTKHRKLLTLLFTVIMAFMISLCRNLLNHKLNYFMGAVFMQLNHTCIVGSHLAAHFKAVWQKHQSGNLIAHETHVYATLHSSVMYDFSQLKCFKSHGCAKQCFNTCMTGFHCQATKAVCKQHGLNMQNLLRHSI